MDLCLDQNVTESLTVKSKEKCISKYNSLASIRPEVQNRVALEGTETQRNWISPELLEVIESVPYHEHFIHTYEGALPRG